MSSPLPQNHISSSNSNFRNNFSFLGIAELVEEPSYLTIFEFEKHDYIPIYFWLKRNMFWLSALGPIYVLLVLALQRFMRDRRPFDLRRPLMVWSGSLALLSLAMFVRMLPEHVFVIRGFGWYSLYCKRDHFNSATVFWVAVYTVSKIMEFVDTLFIVLRKQGLTFLHVFHHTTVYVACLFGLIRADPAARFFALMNTFVHLVMYSYYALKAAQFKLPRKLAMAVTAVQLVQFTAACVINLLVVYAKVMGSKPDCERPNDISAYYFALGSFYLYLFGDFFVQTYLRKSSVKRKSK